MPTAIVTGATSGIGKAAALRLGDASWWVLAGGLDVDRGAAVEKELEARAGGRFFGGDITQSEARQGMVEAALEATGRVDLLVNNAGIHFLADLVELDLKRLERLLDVNLTSAIALAKEVLPTMLSQGAGTIINVASEAGLVAVPGQVAYNVSKAGMIMLSRSIAADYAAHGIRAVSICPGTTRTPLVDEAIRSAEDPEAHERMLASSRPANRLGEPDEIAEAIALVASERISYLNGTEIAIDGGYTVV